MKKNSKERADKKLFKCFISTCQKFGRGRDMFSVTYTDFVSPYPGAPKAKQEFSNVLVCRSCMRAGGYGVVESLGLNERLLIKKIKPMVVIPGAVSLGFVA